jgi:hypothetical protein
MKQVSPSTASDSVTMPGRSSRLASGSLDSSTLPSTRASATPASGTWTRNTHSQLDSATIAPPMIGPKPRPMPKTTPQVAKARLRSLPCWNWCESTASWQISIAPPLRPCRKRAAISTGALCARPQASEVAPNSATLTTRMRLRP